MLIVLHKRHYVAVGRCKAVNWYKKDEEEEKMSKKAFTANRGAAAGTKLLRAGLAVAFGVVCGAVRYRLPME